MKTKIATQKIVKGKKKGLNSIPSFDQALLGLGVKIMAKNDLK